jgi:uncharacterized protein YjlB
MLENFGKQIFSEKQWGLVLGINVKRQTTTVRMRFDENGWVLAWTNHGLDFTRYISTLFSREIIQSTR